MTVTKAGLKEGWTEFVEDLKPYAASTIQFNRNLGQLRDSDSSDQQNVAWVKTRTAELALDLDRLYFHTRHPGHRVAATDRFDAFCVVEKTGVNPHLHMAWFQQQAADPLFREVDGILRTLCLLETFNSGHRELPASDRMLLEQFRGRRTQFKPCDVRDWHASGWSAVTNGIFSSGWSKYIAKEQGFRLDFADQVFFLSDFYGSQRRTKPTRYHVIDDMTGALMLNLDAPLVPRK